MFLLLAYSTAMTQYIGADISGNMLSADLVTAPTYLGGGAAALAGSFLGVEGYWGNVLQMLFGYMGGSIGETCKLAVLAGGAYLIFRRVIDWRIPAVYLLTAAVMVLACYQSASEILLQLLSGGCCSAPCSWRRTTPPPPNGRITAFYTRWGWASSPCSSAASALIPRARRCHPHHEPARAVMDHYILPVRFGS